MQEFEGSVTSPESRSNRDSAFQLHPTEAPNERAQPTTEGLSPNEVQAHDGDTADHDDDEALSGVPQINPYGSWGFPDPFDIADDSGTDADGEAGTSDIADNDGEVIYPSNAGPDFSSEELDLATQLSPEELQRIAAFTAVRDQKSAAREGATDARLDRQPQQATDPLLAGSLPRPRDDAGPMRMRERPGCRWQSGECFTITQTVVYSIDMGSGQVHDIKCSWEEVQGGNSNEEEAFDLYVHLAGLQDAEEADGLDLK